MVHVHHLYTDGANRRQSFFSISSAIRRPGFMRIWDREWVIFGNFRNSQISFFFFRFKKATSGGDVAACWAAEQTAAFEPKRKTSHDCKLALVSLSVPCRFAGLPSRVPTNLTGATSSAPLTPSFIPSHVECQSHSVPFRSLQIYLKPDWTWPSAC
jgi:hypothetical protein